MSLWFWQIQPVAESARGTVMQRNSRGEYVPAIPLPFIGLRKKCHCGAKFWTTEGYRAHYALRHIIDPERTRA